MPSEFSLVLGSDERLQKPESVFSYGKSSPASLLYIFSRERCSVPVKNLEFWEKRARKLVAINSHMGWLSSAAYLCLQQESMSVSAQSRLLEAVAKSIRHLKAMSTILATEPFSG